MKIKILTIILALFFIVSTASASPFNANAKTKRIPAGTKFSLKLMSPLSTSGGIAGADFSAMLITDTTVDNDVILPSGSMVRGSVSKIVPSKRLSKGAVLYVDFDHIVTPNGRQVPLSMSIVGRTDMTYDGGITTTRGYGDAVKQTWRKTVDITKASTEWGDDIAAGTPVRFVTIPLCAVGGGIGGGVYFVGDSIADLIRKGKDVMIAPGEIINVILDQPIDVPVI